MSHKQRAQRNAQIRHLLSQFRKRGCVICGLKEPCCLTAHHVDPQAKRFNLSSSLYRSGISIVAVKREIAKCVCLCYNHHRLVEAGLRELP